jgi:hypothetical protein
MGGEGLSPRFVCQKGIAKDLEQPGLAFTTGTAKGVNRRADPDIDKTALLKDLPQACARQASGNSVGPQVDIAEGACRNLLAVRDVGNCRRPAGLRTRKISAKTWRLLAQKLTTPLLITRRVFDRQALNHVLPKLYITQTHGGRRGARPLEHFLDHVDADDATFGLDLSSREKAVEPASSFVKDAPF